MIFPEVFCYDFSGDTYTLAELEPFLSGQRYSYCAGMKNRSAALRSAYSYMLLRYALKKTFGITEKPVFSMNEYGKPFLAGRPDIFFNMSHAGNTVICAAADSPVGVDIQDIRRLNMNTGRKFLTNNEFENVNELEGDELDRELCRIWCIKESYGKMTGKGFGEGFRSFEADSLLREGRAFLTFHNGFYISLCI